MSLDGLLLRDHLIMVPAELSQWVIDLAREVEEALVLLLGQHQGGLVGYPLALLVVVVAHGAAFGCRRGSLTLLGSQAGHSGSVPELSTKALSQRYACALKED
ncbi:hypothetical protein NDU88_003404 [Pleurodeles waltl]|uniref:Uncharacterized protein n=1 Tax=Pleurodeles waltl TaxID=8319 RepID=A0AAV7SFN2_PLEWA|nr:hypothetical protein NDU88_003404 [Pleurodeles waltl]